MALTGRVITSAYRKDQYDLKNPLGTPATQGVPINFPGALCLLTPAPINTVANGVTMLSIIELLPTGLYQNGQSHKYYSADSVSTLNTNGS
jgi:hypothetical protein